MQLGIGTVEFGQNYGISNKTGKTPEAEVEKILYLAENAGIRTIDTAAHYGDSEKILGRLLKPNHSFQIITKIPSMNKEDLSSGE